MVEGPTVGCVCTKLICTNAAADVEVLSLKKRKEKKERKKIKGS